MNRSISRLALMSMALLSCAAFAQGSANVSGVPGVSAPERVSAGGFPLEGKAPKGYVSPQDRVRVAGGGQMLQIPTTDAAGVAQMRTRGDALYKASHPATSNTVTTPSGQVVALPAGMHPNSIGAQSFIAKAEREAGASCSKKPCVPVIGRTADNKYPVYDLQGEPGDLNYISKGANTVFQPTDLYGRMGYVADADAHAKGMRCDYVCKNAAGQFVGIDPEVKKFDPTLKKK